MRMRRARAHAGIVVSVANPIEWQLDGVSGLTMHDGAWIKYSDYRHTRRTTFRRRRRHSRLRMDKLELGDALSTLSVGKLNR